MNNEIHTDEHPIHESESYSSDTQENKIEFRFQKKVSKDIINICQPFFNTFNAVFFSHTRAHHDGQFSALMTNAELTEHYLNLKYPIAASLGKGLYLKSGIYLASDIDGSLLRKIRLNVHERFNIGNMIYLIDKYNHHDDMYVFASTPQDTSFISKFINNMDVVKHFILYFKDRSFSLMKKVKPIMYGKEYFEHSNNVKGSASLNANERESCFQNMKLKKAHIYNGKREVSLSKREYDCLKYLTKNHTLKEIGKFLNLSPRTVETYLNSLKNKLLCYNRAEVIEMINQNILI